MDVYNGGSAFSKNGTSILHCLVMVSASVSFLASIPRFPCRRLAVVALACRLARGCGLASTLFIASVAISVLASTLTSAWASHRHRSCSGVASIRILVGTSRTQYLFLCVLLCNFGRGLDPRLCVDSCFGHSPGLGSLRRF